MVAQKTEQVRGGLVEIDGAGYYAVADVDRMAPFLMSVVSDGDRWMFVSSSGALTAGRADTAGALFPYETDDRLHRAAGVSGPVTAIRVLDQKPDEVWTPFRRQTRPDIRRCLFKAVVGESIIFEEIHPELALRFRYRWSSSDSFGFVRTATIINEGDQPVRADLMDGLVNLLPYGLVPSLYQGMSNLTNAYKRSEVLDDRHRLAVYSLESQVADRPEPAESLRASVVWSVGFEQASLSLSPDSLSDFETGRGDEAAVSLVTGTPGAYLLRGRLELEPADEVSWHIVADVAHDQIAVADLRNRLHTETHMSREIEASLHESSESLVKIMAPADALQRTGDRIATAHQFANVTYNVMRGGVPLSGYQVRTSEFADFVTDRNRLVADRHRSWLESLPAVMGRTTLQGSIQQTGDAHLIRLGLEYLPFSFSRRHGDPSRPWNAFSIRVRDGNGRPIIYYQGNWRDIFQNWEALCMSFPEYLPGVISLFVNASTPDGYNPYRITSQGIDWEVPDPDDPWSNIGHWGDHQIVYLLRLLETSERFLPGEIKSMLEERWFTYADIPYRLAGYDQLVEDPKATIRYDETSAGRSAAQVDAIGSDGKLLLGAEGEPHLVSLVEKLLVSALSKLSNFVPGGGIWMNTQRPEWNDANNALVGYGLSMVTLYHLRRYLDHFRTMISASDLEEVAVSTEVAQWLTAVTSAFETSDRASVATTDRSRKELMDQLGRAFANYRSQVYASGFSGFTPITVGSLIDLVDVATKHLDETIRTSQRSDGLYDSYNLIHFSSDESTASVENLHEMLEGQVAVLSSGVLTSQEQADVVDALFSSDMYRADQNSFMLYPIRQLPSFIDKNVIPAEAMQSNPLLTALLEAGDLSVVGIDVDGRFRFNAAFANQDKLDAELDQLATGEQWADLVAEHRATTLATYEAVFGHHAYTGRSGSMYAYEGIGSIYWHMVAKLAVAVQEAALAAADEGVSRPTLDRLTGAYWRIRSGLGFNKTAEEFGAIPIDPYSHTPAHAGAQQPGMTGLVKEELLTRPLEVGVRVANGEIRFDPLLLRTEELLTQTESWQVYDLELEPVNIRLDEGSLGMTFCQVPIVVSTTPGEARLEIILANGTTEVHAGLTLGSDPSSKVFGRTGEIAQIHAHIPHDSLHTQGSRSKRL